MKPLRLLVVDDIAPIRCLLAQLFEKDGYEVEQAADAEEALALARMARWDGFILDIDMPGMNGLELYANLVRLNAGDRLPVIFFSGRPSEGLELSLANVPWARMVAKPCAPAQLLVLMRQCLLAAARCAPQPNSRGDFSDLAPRA